jgi:hypothetical protein
MGSGVSSGLRLVGVALILALVALTSLVSYLFFHTVAEVMFAVVGFSVLIMALTLREFLDDDFPVFIGVGLGAASLLQLIHMVDFPGMDVIGESVDPPTQLWLAARGLTALTFVAAPFVLGHRIRLRVVAPVFAAVVALVLAAIYWWDVFPSAYSLETGLTTFKVAAEYAISALFALAIVMLWRRRTLLPVAALPLLLGALVASIVAELFFTLYTGPDTWPNMAGHIFLVLSAVLVYLGLVEDSLARPHAVAVGNLREAKLLHERLERSLLPTLPVTHPSVDVLTHYRPGEHQLELGGDFIDVLEEKGGRLAVICGDVSGHGPDAAALGAMLRVGWEALLLSGAAPHQIVASLREVVVRERQSDETFATACLAWVDPERNELSLLNIGHPPPLLLGDQGTVALAAPPLPPLGTLDMPVGAPIRLELPAAWSLVFYTDGLIEGRQAPGSVERFGERRLIETFDGLSCGPLDKACLDDVMETVERAGGEPFHDDVTVVVLTNRRVATAAGEAGGAQAEAAAVTGGRGYTAATGAARTATDATRPAGR